MNNLIYWSPFLGNVGTIKSTINSAISFKKFYSNRATVKIINACGEWDDFKEIIEKNNIELVNLTFNYVNYLPKSGLIKSRISYILIFLISFFPLLRFLKKEKSSFFISHLITSLPMFLNLFFNLKVRMILRISGYPKLHFLRKKFWQMATKKIHIITCPTVELKKNLEKLNIFNKSIIKFLPDAIIDVNDFLIKQKENILLPTKKKFILSVGRLTKQKNYKYLINEICDFLKNNAEYDLIILGDGEERKILNNLINNIKMNNRIFLLGHKKNQYFYMKNASALILSSLWEEVGFVIVESALCNLLVFSSDCQNGPKEFLSNGDAGFLFKTNEQNALKKIIVKIKDDNFSKKVLAKKNSLKYTRFRHFKCFKEILKI